MSISSQSSEAMDDDKMSRNLARISLQEEEGEEFGEETLETLETLLQVSRTPQGRSLLASTRTFPSLLRRLSSSSSSSHTLLLSHLRLLRNLCADEIANQNSFLEAHGPDQIAAIVLRSPPAHPEIIRAGLQLLGNVALGGEEHRSSVWPRFFPDGFLGLAKVRELGVFDPLCMVLYTCCFSGAGGGRGRLEQLCGVGTGLPILLEVIKTASTVGYREEWLKWLFSKICFEEPYFSLLFPKLGSLSDSDNCDGVGCRYTLFTQEQSFLLGLLSNYLNNQPDEVIISKDFALYVLKVLKEAYGVVDFTSRGQSRLPTGSPAIDVLGYSLNILRDTCAWECTSLAATEAPVDLLLSAGIVELLLSMLHDLEPPLIIRKHIAHARDQRALPTMADPLKVCPYEGFRRDIVSVISICLSGRKQVQDEIRQRNGIMLLLQQCVIDEDNPLLREWGIMAVRNLLERNVENQREVAELELQGPLDTPEIAELGLRVEVDEKSRRAKLVNIS